MHTPAGSEHNDELVDRLLERLEELSRKNHNATFAELVAQDDEIARLLASDSALAARLSDQLAALQQMGGLFSPAPTDCDGLSPPGYQILGRLGHGGAGVVYRARQVSLGREVALKVMLGGRFASDRTRQRFRREAETAARLQHPQIAQVFDHGEFDGLPYLTQELVPGGSLAERIARKPLNATQAGRLMESLARAVHYAHQCGVVHRDLKPANVLLDDQGEPKIVDFGLAKAMDFDSQLTRTGEAPGTPSYMAPEQIQGADVGPRTDVYGLGTILYEALVGAPPFTGTSAADVYGKVLNVPAGFRRDDSQAIPYELRAIALKCLEKIPSQRYDSAAALADDLRRWSEGLPIEARPLAPAARAFRWARRRPAVAALIAVSTLAAAMLFVGSILYSISLTSLLRLAADRQRELEAKQAEIERQQYIMRQHLYAANMPLVQKAYDRNNIAQARELLARHVPQNGEQELRGFAWYLLDHLCNSERLCLRGHDRDVYTVCHSPDGRLLATCGQDGTVRLWDASDGRTIGVLRGHAGELQGIAFSPDGKLLASGDDEGVIRLWPVEAVAKSASATSASPTLFGDSTYASRTIELGHQSPVWSLAFSRDGMRLAIGTRVNLQIHDLESKTVSRIWEGLDREVKSIVFDASGKQVFFATQHKIIAGNIESGQLRPAVDEHSNHVSVLALAHSGELLASSDQSGGIKLWDPKTLTAVPGSFSQIDRIDGLAFSPDDKLLSIAGKQRTIELWDVATRTRKLSLYGHTGPIWSTEFSPDGAHLASASGDGTVRIWELQSVCPRELGDDTSARNTCVAFSSNGDTLAVGNSQGKIEFWDWARGRLLADREIALPARAAPSEGESAPSIRGLDYSLDGNEIFSLSSDGYFDRWDAKTKAHLGRSGLLPGSASGFCRAADTNLVAVWDDGKCSRIWDSQSRNCPLPMTWPIHNLQQMSLSADGRLLTALERGGNHLRLLRLSDGSLEKNWTFPVETANCMTLSADGRWAVTGGNGIDRAVHLWDLLSGRELASFIGHTSEVTSVAFCPDGRTLVSASTDGSLRLWDLDARQELLTIEPNVDRVDTLVFSRDGRALAAIGTTAEGSTRVFVWSIREHLSFRVAPPKISDSTTRPFAVGSARESVDCEPEDPINAVTVSIATFNELRVSAAVRVACPPANKILVTFEERFHEGELQVACVLLPGAIERRHDFDDLTFQGGVPALARRINAGKESAFVWVMNPHDRWVHSIHPPVEAIELRKAPAAEVGQSDDVFERFRRVHRWAKTQGYVGGFPTFDDDPSDGATQYGVALIKPSHGTEVWVPLAGPALQ